MGNLSGVEITTLRKATGYYLTNISLKQTFPAQTVEVSFWFTAPEKMKEFQEEQYENMVMKLRGNSDGR